MSVISCVIDWLIPLGEIGRGLETSTYFMIIFAELRLKFALCLTVFVLLPHLAYNSQKISQSFIPITYFVRELLQKGGGGTRLGLRCLTMVKTSAHAKLLFQFWQCGGFFSNRLYCWFWSRYNSFWVLRSLRDIIWWLKFLQSRFLASAKAKLSCHICQFLVLCFKLGLILLL